MDSPNPPYFEEKDFSKKAWFSSLYQWITRRTKVVNVTTTYSVAADVFWVRCDATGAAFTVTLPASLPWNGRQIGVKKMDASVNAVTVSRAGSDLIDGATTVSLASRYDKTLVIADGSTNWDRLI